MDEYPPLSLDHNVPLLTILGAPAEFVDEPTLDFDLKEEAILLRSEPPPVETEQASPLIQYIKHSDAARKYRFRVRTAGRSYLLPSRRARLPENFDPPESPPILHSPFSPLSPACHLYPDGLVDIRWLKKHQELIPSVFVYLYSLTTDPTLSTLHDNKIKTDIGGIRNALLQSGYKSRLAVIILVDQTSPSAEGVQERLDNIRKGAGLDPKSFFSIPTHSSQEDLERTSDNALVTIYGQALEYYRDLGRHARKKRGRGVVPQPTVPPTSGTSQTLSLFGWNVRYDFKSAIFAEYRQEMDVALRSYEQAYETLLSAEILEVIPSWSPRWNEARLLSDIIAIRCIRCLLWNEQYTAAVRRWQSHRERIADFLDRRGRGTNNYGWKAWEARWAIVMADLVEKMGVNKIAASNSLLFLPPEKLVMGERLQPWELLHHTGYWYRSAARHTFARRHLARLIPEDDRRPPSMSPASQVASKAFTYDTYMCPEPYEELPVIGNSGVNHSQLILKYLTAAESRFTERGQRRLAAELSMECAREYASVKDWQGVLQLLRPLWEDGSLRAEGWLDIIEDLAWTLRAAAAYTAQADVVVPIDWVLLNKKFTRRQNWHYDLSKALDGVNVSKQQIKTSDDLMPSFLSTSFLFRHEEGKAGQTVQAQLSISSNAFSDSAPLIFQRLSIDFGGSIKPISVEHDPSKSRSPSASGHVVLQSVDLKEQGSEPTDETGESSSSLMGYGDLTLAPGHTTVLAMAIPLREAGDASATSITFIVDNDAFTLEHTTQLADGGPANMWFASPSSRKRIARTHPHSVRILPRPPKMEIKPLNLRGQYYTNELIELTFDIVNEEDAEAQVKLDVVVLGEDPPNFRLKVSNRDESRALADGDESKLLGVPLDVLNSSESSRVSLFLTPLERTSAYTLTLKAHYNLVTDPATPIVQATEFHLDIASPFEANYDLFPSLNTDPWPSLFDYEGVQGFDSDSHASQQFRGLSQTWRLATHYASFASDDLKVTDLDIDVAPAHGVRSHVTKREKTPAEGILVSPSKIQDAEFEVIAQKASLDDRNPVSLDVTFLIKWTRLGEEEAINRTILPVPRLNIFGPEPRVLASVSYTKNDPMLVLLQITIENPSNHFLTFGLTMDPSEEFAFSGSKQTTMHLLPLSRRSTVYRLLPLVEDAWVKDTWIKPTLVVRDKYFQKVLRVIPTEGMKLDKDGFVVYVPGSQDMESH